MSPAIQWDALNQGRAMTTRSVEHSQPLAGVSALGECISYTPEQAAAVTGRSRSRIFKAIKDRELTAHKDGKATLLERDELRRWVRSLPTIGRRSEAA
jgi:excisionase family DNA binding protein